MLIIIGTFDGDVARMGSYSTLEDDGNIKSLTIIVIWCHHIMMEMRQDWTHSPTRSVMDWSAKLPTSQGRRQRWWRRQWWCRPWWWWWWWRDFFLPTDTRHFVSILTHYVGGKGLSRLEHPQRKNSFGHFKASPISSDIKFFYRPLVRGKAPTMRFPLISFYQQHLKKR